MLLRLLPVEHKAPRCATYRPTSHDGIIAVYATNAAYNSHTGNWRWWAMSQKQQPKTPAELPVSSPFCADPNCPYCKQLRELQEEIRKKNDQEQRSA